MAADDPTAVTRTSTHKLNATWHHLWVQYYPLLPVEPEPSWWRFAMAAHALVILRTPGTLFLSNSGSLSWHPASQVQRSVCSTVPTAAAEL